MLGNLGEVKLGKCVLVKKNSIIGDCSNMGMQERISDKDTKFRKIKILQRRARIGPIL